MSAGDLTTAAELAERWGMSEEQFHEKRRRQGWPHVALGRFNIRFTDAQIEQIIAMRTKAPAKTVGTKVDGQTDRSKSRSRAAS